MREQRVGKGLSVAKVRYKSAGRAFVAANDNSVTRARVPGLRVYSGAGRAYPWFNTLPDAPPSYKARAASYVRLEEKLNVAYRKMAPSLEVQKAARVRYQAMRTAGAGVLLPQVGFNVWASMMRMMWRELFERMNQAVQSSWMRMICGYPVGMPTVGVSAVCNVTGTRYTFPPPQKTSIEWVTLKPLGPPIYPEGLFQYTVQGRAGLKAGAPAAARFPGPMHAILPFLQPHGVGSFFPSIDPLSMPIHVFMPTPRPLPWGFRRVPNPFRASTERWGERIGDEPNVLSPKKSTSASAPIWSPSAATAPAPISVAPPRVIDEPPGPGKKERKGKVAQFYWAFLQAYGAYTEYADTVRYVYRATAAAERRAYEKKLGRRPNTSDEFKFVYRNSDKIDMARAVENIVWGNISDAAYGALGRYTVDKPLQKLMPNFEQRMLLRATVREFAHRNDLHTDAFVHDWLRSLLQSGRQVTRPAFEAVF
ncbi:hypothetical protein [Microviridae sp.]|nr:hypothetical protein [Microviridae sp.]